MTNLYEYWEQKLATRLRRRITERNLNAIVGFFGQTGSGKSYSGFRLAELVDRTFDIHRIAFDVDPFLELVDSNLPRGSGIMFDDAGLGMNSRDWQTASNRILSKVAQSFRFKGHLTIITAPDITMIDSQVRSLFHLIFQTIRKDMEHKLVVTMPVRPQRGVDGKSYAKFPKEEGDFGIGRLKRFSFNLPSMVDGPMDTWTEYEDIKEQRLNPMYAGWRKQVRVPPQWVVDGHALVLSGLSKTEAARKLGKDRSYFSQSLKIYYPG